MKATFHKYCDCKSCKYAKSSKRGKLTRKYNERKLRKVLGVQLKKRELEDIEVGPISSPRLG